jgi:hypothetical protein
MATAIAAAQASALINWLRRQCLKKKRERKEEKKKKTGGSQCIETPHSYMQVHYGLLQTAQGSAVIDVCRRLFHPEPHQTFFLLGWHLYSPNWYLREREEGICIAILNPYLSVFLIHSLSFAISLSLSSLMVQWHSHLFPM